MGTGCFSAVIGARPLAWRLLERRVGGLSYATEISAVDAGRRDSHGAGPHPCQRRGPARPWQRRRRTRGTGSHGRRPWLWRWLFRVPVHVGVLLGPVLGGPDVGRLGLLRLPGHLR